MEIQGDAICGSNSLVAALTWIGCACALSWSTPADNDYGYLRLRLTSRAIDAGDNSALPPGITIDLAGQSRFLDVPIITDTGLGTSPIVDMGAYETRSRAIYLPLVLR